VAAAQYYFFRKAESLHRWPAIIIALLFRGKPQNRCTYYCRNILNIQDIVALDKEAPRRNIISSAKRNR